MIFSAFMSLTHTFLCFTETYMPLRIKYIRIQLVRVLSDVYNVHVNYLNCVIN